MAENIQKKLIEEEMKESYVDYAMSVIVSRALPDVRDGLKPVHRRVLFAMHQLGLQHNKPFKKSANVVGNTMAKYHPHGDMAIYDTLVRMAQDFSLRYPLVNGQGNFGCFTIDTKIALTDGRNLSFKELIEEHKNGKKNYTYTINDRGSIEIAEIINPRLTKKNQKIIKVILDNGEDIKCTLNHRFMLRDGQYKEAQYLKPEDSLMPLYLRLSTEKDSVKPSSRGYQMIYQPNTDNWVPSHNLADDWNLRNKVYDRTAGRIRHHFLSRYDAVTPEVYEAERHNNCIPKVENAVKYFGSFSEIIEHAKKYNHKIVGIEFLEEESDVYDLTIEGTHNFSLASGIFVHNSIDGDAASAMRYTESKMTKIAEEIILDIDKETVDFIPNYDGSESEPTVLPSKVPNLLINGSSGIAVGMATNMAPHNIREVCDAVIASINKPDISVQDLMGIMPGPDFPTGGYICGRKGILDAYNTGRGRIVLRAKTDIEDKGDRKKIIVTEVPYQVNKAAMIEAIADLVRDKRIEGISDIRDESDRTGIRVVFDVKKGFNENVIINQLYHTSQLQTTFGVINIALVDGQPRVLGLKDLIHYYIAHRRDIIIRRTKFDLLKAEEKAHILEGLRIALQQIDAVIKTIKSSKDANEAKAKLMNGFKLSDKQAQAILDMKLQRLTSLEQENLQADYNSTIALIQKLKDILASEQKILGIIKNDLTEIKNSFGDDRRTEILDQEEEIGMEDRIREEDVVVTVTHSGYIKKLPVQVYKQQKRGGKGIKGTELKEEDAVEHAFTTSTHNHILFFTNKGKVHWLKAYSIPTASRYSKGKAIINLISLDADERITTVVPVSEFSETHFLLMATKKGLVKKTALTEYSRPRKGGIVAINLREGDELVQVLLTDGKLNIMLATKKGMAVKFNEQDVTPIGRTGMGVKGIKLKNKGDEVIGMENAPDAGTLLTVTENGYGKRTDINEYTLIKRGGSGVINIKTTERNGDAVGIKTVTEEDEILVVTKKGQMIRMRVKGISSIGRATQGVKIMTLDEGDSITTIAKVVAKSEE